MVKEALAIINLAGILLNPTQATINDEVIETKYECGLPAIDETGRPLLSHADILYQILYFKDKISGQISFERSEMGPSEECLVDK